MPTLGTRYWLMTLNLREKGRAWSAWQSRTGQASAMGGARDREAGGREKMLGLEVGSADGPCWQDGVSCVHNGTTCRVLCGGLQKVVCMCCAITFCAAPAPVVCRLRDTLQSSRSLASRLSELLGTCASLERVVLATAQPEMQTGSPQHIKKCNAVLMCHACYPTAAESSACCLAIPGGQQPST